MITRGLKHLINGLARLRLGSVRHTLPDADNNSYIIIPEEEEKINRHAPLSSELSNRFTELTSALVEERDRLIHLNEMKDDSSTCIRIFLNTTLLGELVGIGLCIGSSAIPVAAILTPGLWTAAVSAWLDLVVGLHSTYNVDRNIASTYDQHLAPDIEIAFAYHALKNTTEEEIQHNQNELLKIKNNALMAAELKIQSNMLIAAEFRLFATERKIPAPVQTLVLEYADLVDSKTQDGTPSYLKPL